MGETRQRQVGWTMLALLALFLVMASALPKFISHPAAIDSMAQLGWPVGFLPLLGTIEVACALLVLWPRTALLGAALTMALLGGAIATNLRAGTPLFSHTLFSVYLGAWMWAGLLLRDPALRQLFPLRR
jgi:hypothetical protein